MRLNLFLCILLCAANWPDLPDPKLTPGKTTDVIVKKLCTPGYSKTARNVPESEKKEVFKLYGVPYSEHSRFEIDHEISLELGGSNEIENLWPEHYAEPNGAHDKDKLENRLHWNVCHGKMSLKDAQEAVTHNWMEQFKKENLK